MAESIGGSHRTSISHSADFVKRAFARLDELADQGFFDPKKRAAMMERVGFDPTLAAEIAAPAAGRIGVQAAGAREAAATNADRSSAVFSPAARSTSLSEANRNIDSAAFASLSNIGSQASGQALNVSAQNASIGNTAMMSALADRFASERDRIQSRLAVYQSVFGASNQRERQREQNRWNLGTSLGTAFLGGDGGGGGGGGGGMDFTSVLSMLESLGGGEDPSTKGPING